MPAQPRYRRKFERSTTRLRSSPAHRRFFRIVLREPLLLLPGDRFIIRMFSPVVTIGGGEVLDSRSASPQARKALLERAHKLLAGAHYPSALRCSCQEAPDGISIETLVARVGLRPDAILRSLPDTIHRFGDWLMHQTSVQAKLVEAKQYLAAFHREHPLAPGCSKEELRSRVLANAPSGVFDQLLSLDKQFVTRRRVRSAQLLTKSRCKPNEQDASARIEAAFANAGLQVPSLAEVLENRAESIRRARARCSNCC